MTDTLGLGSLDTLLSDEGYKPAQWIDHDDSVIDHQGATVASFKSLTQYGIAIVDAFGDDQVLAIEQYCDPLMAVDALYGQYQADLAAGYLMITAIPGTASCPSALDHNEQQWVQKMDAEAQRVGGNPNELAVHVPTSIADPGPVQWAIGATEKGVVTYLGGEKLSLLFLSTCGGHSLVGGLLVDAVFSYEGCGNFADDLKNLFDALYGSDGSNHRGTDTAYADITQSGATGLQYDHFGGPVLLSPAVTATDAKTDTGSETSFLVPGTSTQVTVTFDTEMSSSSPVTVAGCGATIDGDQTWNADGTQLQFKIKVPDHPADFSADIVIQAKDATASSASGWPNTLSGNGSGGSQNGEGPNNNDYLWQMPCANGLDLTIDGTDGGKPIQGEVIGYPTPELTCVPVGSGGKGANVVHWDGYTSITNTPISGEFDVQYGTWPLGDAQGDQQISIDEIVPTYDHLPATSGTITQNPGGGSIDVTVSGDGDTMHVSGTWTCPSGASQAP